MTDQTDRLKVTRTIVIEGPRDWVEMTLDPVRCLVPLQGSVKTFQGTITCIHRTDDCTPFAEKQEKP